MDHSQHFSSDQLAHLEALRAYAAQIQGDDDFRGDPRIVDQGRALIARAVKLGLPADLCREVQAVVGAYDDQSKRPPADRAPWFKKRRTAAQAGKRRDFVSLVRCVLLRHLGDRMGFAATADDIIAASRRIPDDMTARDAALEFCAFTIDGFAETGGEGPTWFELRGRLAEQDAPGGLAVRDKLWAKG